MTLKILWITNDQLYTRFINLNFNKTPKGINNVSADWSGSGEGRSYHSYIILDLHI